MLVSLVFAFVGINSASASLQALRAMPFDRANGARPCPVSRGSVHANPEDALSACEQTDHCRHGARCLPCALAQSVECDVEGASVECGHSFMCDVTSAAVDRVPRWQLHDNRIQSDAPQPPDLN